jgi:hypothetical protein
MFGKKRNEKREFEQASYEGSVCMTMAQACLALDANENAHGVVTKFLGNILLGTMFTLDLHPNGKPYGDGTWRMVRATLGPTGDSWQITAELGKHLDQSLAAAVPQMLAPLVGTTRDNMETTFTNALAPYFGQSEGAALDRTAQLVCFHAGLTLVTVWEDIQTVPQHEMNERMSFALFNEGLFVLLAAQTESARRWHEEQRDSE